MSVQLTMINDDIYDTDHLDGQIKQDSIAHNTSYGSTVISFQSELKKKDYVDAMERIAAAADNFDW